MESNSSDEHVTNDDDYYYDNNDSGNDDCSKGDVDDGVDCDGCRHKHTVTRTHTNVRSIEVIIKWCWQ